MQRKSLYSLLIFIFLISYSFCQIRDFKLLDLEYAFFSAQTDSVKATILLRKADHLFQTGEYSASIEELERIGKLQLHQTLKDSVLETETVYHFMNKRFDRAYDRSSNLSIKRLNTQPELQYIYLQSLVQLKLFETCKQSLVGLGYEDSIVRSLPDSISYFNPDIYKRRSAIFPSWGQYSLGNVKDGTSSLVLCSSFGAFTVYNFMLMFPATAVVYGFVPFYKFYTGGKLNAESTAEHRNESAELELKRQYSDVIDSLLFE